MKRWFAGLLLVVFAVAALVWFLPARWALPLLQARLRGVRLEGVSGTLWQGQVEHVSIVNGPQLGRLAWTLSHRALLGDVRLGLDLRQPHMQFHGQVHRLSSSLVELHDVTLRMDMAMLGPQAWLRGEPQGTLALQVPQASLQDRWPMQLDMTGTWSQASVHTAQGAVPLGGLSLAATGQSGVILGTLNDDGSGIVQTAGRLTFSPLGWDMQWRLVPRRDDPVVSSWLRSLGRPAADGTLELRYRGGLAQLSPAAKQ